VESKRKGPAQWQYQKTHDLQKCGFLWHEHEVSLKERKLARKPQKEQALQEVEDTQDQTSSTRPRGVNSSIYQLEEEQASSEQRALVRK